MELVQRAADDARELIRLEIDLAKNEMRQELEVVMSSAILVAVAITLGLTGLASLVIALGLALGSLAVLAIALLLLASAAISGAIGYRRLPKKVMAATGLRLRDDQALLNGHLS
jgi:hypothetical protein